MKDWVIEVEIDQIFEQTAIFIQTPQAATGTDLVTYLEAFEKQKKPLVIKQDDRYIVLPLDAIIYCEVYQKTLTIYTETDQYETKETLKKMVDRLSNEEFLQVSKSAIVKMSAIQELEVAFSGNYYAYLTNPLKVNISRRFVDELKKRLQI